MLSYKNSRAAVAISDVAHVLPFPATASEIQIPVVSNHAQVVERNSEFLSRLISSSTFGLM